MFGGWVPPPVGQTMAVGQDAFGSPPASPRRLKILAEPLMPFSWVPRLCPRAQDGDKAVAASSRWGWSSAGLL